MVMFDAKMKRQAQQERLQKLGMSKPPRDQSGDAVVRRVTIPSLGDVKKDKLKNSLGLTNEEKEKLVRREKEMSRNRGVCMVRTFCAP